MKICKHDTLKQIYLGISQQMGKFLNMLQCGSYHAGDKGVVKNIARVGLGEGGLNASVYTKNGVCTSISAHAHAHAHDVFWCAQRKDSV